LRPLPDTYSMSRNGIVAIEYHDYNLRIYFSVPILAQHRPGGGQRYYYLYRYIWDATYFIASKCVVTQHHKNWSRGGAA